MKTNLDALLTVLYVHLDDHVLRSADRPRRRGPARTLNDAELVCVAVAQVLLGCDSERRWLRSAPGRIGHLFPRLPGQSEYNRHLRDAAPALFAAAMWLVRRVPSWQERLRLMDGTPVRCGASLTTVHRSGLGEILGLDTTSTFIALGTAMLLVLVAATIPRLLAYLLPPALISGALSLIRVGGVPLARLVLARCRWRWGMWRGHTRYRASVVIDHPRAFQLPGVLAPLTLLSAEDGYGGRYGIVWDRRAALLTAPLRVVPASTWLADCNDTDNWVEAMVDAAAKPNISVRIMPISASTLEWTAPSSL